MENPFGVNWRRLGKMMKVVLLSFLLLLSGYACAKDSIWYSATGSGLFVMSDGISQGLVDSARNVLIPLGRYKYLGVYEYDMVLARDLKGKEGFTDRYGNILVPFKYDDVGRFYFGLAPVICNKKQGFINPKGELVIPLIYQAGNESVRYFYDPGIASMRMNNKFGVIDTLNHVVIPFRYDNIEVLNNYKFIHVQKEDKWALFSQQGKQLTDFLYDEVAEFTFGALSNSGTVLLRKNDSVAYVNQAIHFIVPFGKFDYGEPFGLNKTAIVGAEHKFGIIDTTGTLLLPLEYDELTRPSIYNTQFANYYVARKNNHYFFFNGDMDPIVSEPIVKYSGGMIKGESGKWGYMSLNRLVYPIVYDSLICGRNSIIARTDSLVGLLSMQQDSVLIPFVYRNIENHFDERFFVTDTFGRVGVLSRDGRVYVDFHYDSISYAFEGGTLNRYIISKDGKYGTIDESDSIHIPIQYDYISGWVEYGPDAHFVGFEGRHGILSYEGKAIIPTVYEEMGFPEAGRVAARKNGKWGVLSFNDKDIKKSNQVILDFEYDKIILDIPLLGMDTPAPRIAVCRNGVWSYFSLNGKLIRSDIPHKEIENRFGVICFQSRIIR